MPVEDRLPSGELTPEVATVEGVDADALRKQREEDVYEVTATLQQFERHWGPVYARIRDNNALTYGDQWEGDDAALAQTDTDLAAGSHKKLLSLNRVLPMVMQLLGISINSPVSWKAIPIDDYADENVAAVITKLFKHTEIDNLLDWVRFQVRMAGVCGGFGWYYVPPPNPEEDDELLVKIYSEPAEFIMLDPDARDLTQRDWKRVIRVNWMTRQAIIDTWPDTEVEITAALPAGRTIWADLSSRLRFGLRSEASRATTGSADYEKVIDTASIRDNMNDLYRVIELWQRRKRWVSDVDPLTGEPKRRREIYMELKIALPFLNILLGRYELPLAWYPFSLFQPINIGTPLVDGISYVDNLRDIQREKNRLRALADDAAQRTINESILLPAGEEALKTDMVNNAGRAGFIGIKATSLPLDRVNSSGMSPGIQYLLEASDVDFQEASMQPLAMAGNTEYAGESGIKFQSRVSQGQAALSPIFFAERMANLVLGRIIIERYQKYYTQPKMFRILGRQPETYESLAINQMNSATGQIINDVTLGRYDIFVENVDLDKTGREFEFKILSEMAKIMPPEVQDIFLPRLIENSPLMERGEVARELRERFQMLSQMAAGGGELGGGAPMG